MGTNLRLTVSKGQGTARVAVAGEIDMETAPQLSACLDRLDADLIVDVSDVTFIDSSGLSTLVASSQRLRALGRGLRIVGPSDSVRTVFEVTGLQGLLGVDG
jgi:anti-sigma B factor antagonist